MKTYRVYRQSEPVKCGSAEYESCLLPVAVVHVESGESALEKAKVHCSHPIVQDWTQQWRMQ